MKFTGETVKEYSRRFKELNSFKKFWHDSQNLKIYFSFLHIVLETLTSKLILIFKEKKTPTPLKKKKIFLMKTIFSPLQNTLFKPFNVFTKENQRAKRQKEFQIDALDEIQCHSNGKKREELKTEPLRRLLHRFAAMIGHAQHHHKLVIPFSAENF